MARICIVCGCEFSNAKGLQKTCSIEHGVILRQETQRINNSRRTNRRQQNPELSRIQNNLYRASHRDQLREYAKQFRKRNPEYYKQWYDQNRDHHSEIMREYHTKARTSRELIQFQFDTEELLTLIRKDN